MNWRRASRLVQVSRISLLINGVTRVNYRSPLLSPDALALYLTLFIESPESRSMYDLSDRVAIEQRLRPSYRALINLFAA